MTVLGGTLEAENVVVAGNRVEAADGPDLPEEVWGTGVITDDGTTARFTNVTVVGNDADVTTAVYGAGWANYDEGTPELTNVTISDNQELSTSTWAAGIYEEGGGEVRMSYANLWGHAVEVLNMADPTGTAGNLAVDPMFLDTSGAAASSWDLRLDASSSLVDAGDPSILDADGTRSDIGAYGGEGGDLW